jgi:hypothetical protein
MNRSRYLWLAASTLLACAGAPERPAATSARELPVAVKSGPVEHRLDVHAFRVLEGHSGDVSYYSVSDDPERPVVKARYRPPWETVVFGYQLDERTRERAVEVRWSWRAVTLPVGGYECDSARNDSAAVVYLGWKRGLRYYTLKYVWSSSVPKGSICDSKRNPFVAQDTIVLQSGPSNGEWKSERIDLGRELRKHFFDGDPSAELPAFLGPAIMSDGDQTRSESAADYADFVVVTR